MASKTKSKEVEKKASGEKAVVQGSFFQDAGLGFEDASKEAYSIPFLVLLQKMSSQCDKDSGEFVKGAEAGMFLNSSTGELYSDSVQIVPCHYNRQLVEWVPRSEGGGFRGTYNPEQLDLSTLNRDESGKFKMSNGNQISDTRYHFVLLLTKSGPRPMVLSLTSTQIKVSRNWMTAMRDQRTSDGRGGMVKVPMMANIWKLSSVTQQNDKGSWKGVKVERERMLKFPEENDLYEMAKEFHHQIATGKAKVDETEKSQTTEESLF